MSNITTIQNYIKVEGVKKCVETFLLCTRFKITSKIPKFVIFKILNDLIVLDLNTQKKAFNDILNNVAGKGVSKERAIEVMIKTISWSGLYQ